MTKQEEIEMRKRADRIQEVALELCEREGERAQREGILDAQDMVAIFAVACTMSVVRFKDFEGDYASKLAGSALRTIIKNLMMLGVEIPSL